MEVLKILVTYNNRYLFHIREFRFVLFLSEIDMDEEAVLESHSLAFHWPEQVPRGGAAHSTGATKRPLQGKGRNNVLIGQK